MALVEAVPAGIYGREALQSLGLWDVVRDRVVQTDNVRAALNLVATGAAPLGLVYGTDVIAETRVHLTARIPAETHSPIRYPAAVLTGASTSAQIFFEYLWSETATRVFSKLGFAPLPQRSS